MKGYLFLAAAILLEVIGTMALKVSAQFTKVVPVIVLTIGYLGSLYFMSLSLKTIPIGITYAIWAGSGIVLLALAGVFFYKEIPDTPAIIGIFLILAGVITINLFSHTTVH